MTKKPGIGDLNEAIERVVREHLAELREGAVAALQRALVGGKPVVAVDAGNGRRRASRARRVPEAVTDLGRRFYEVVSQSPGETMSVLARNVGVTPRELHRPVANLKRAGQVRSVGERQRTRYFPMASGYATT